MNKLSNFLVYFFLLLQFTLGHGGPSKTEVYGYEWKYTIYACNDAIEDYKFGANITGYYPLMCGYAPLTGTVLNCVANEVGPESATFNKSLKRVSTMCTDYAKVNMSVAELRSLYENATHYLLDISTVTTNLTTTKFYQPINVTHEMVKNSKQYYTNLYFNFDKASTLAGIMYFYFILVFILVGGANFIKRLGYHKNFNNSFINWYRAKISIPALFNGKHTEAPVYLKVFSTLWPTRVESVVVFFFICLNVLLTTVNYHFAKGDTPSYIQLMICVADRTGLLSFGLIPLLIIFAGRNNILTSLTGIPYTSFIVYHKWVARFMWIHALIHSACWTAYAVNKSYLTYYSSQAYWIWGVVATIIGGIMLFQAFHVFRNMAYETFLVIHIVLAILFIVACWWHCYELGWLEWIYVSWAVWIFDRLVRIIRMCMFGFTNAQVELIADDTFKISVKHGKWFVPFPGSFAYVYFITPTMFWQSHPFTIIDSALERDVTTIYIKTKAGITKRINKELAKHPGNKKTIRISIEGPYGHRAPMEKYDTALLLAGGNGIPGPYYHAIDLAKRESSTRQQIKLLWVIRNPEALQWFYDELRVLMHTNVQTDVYITAPQTKQDFGTSEKKDSESSDGAEVKKSDGVSSDEDVKSKKLSVDEIIASLSNHIGFHYGRPNLEEIIVNEFTKENQGNHSVGVMSCGPPKMVDGIRTLVAEHLQEAKGRVDLFEELQVW